MNDWIKKLVNGNLQNSPSEIRLGIWGTIGSGKTIYLAKLYEALLESDDWVVTADKKAREFVEEHLRDMDNSNKAGLLPLPTEKTRREVEIFRYTLIPQSSRVAKSNIVLSFIDAAGEFYENRLHANTKVVRKKEQVLNPNEKILEEEYRDIVEYLMSCNGIIILLDPKRSSKEGESYRTLLFDLFNEFQERSRNLNINLDRLEQYIAFCVTKVDDNDELWQKGQNPQQFAQEVMGQKMWKSLINNFSYVELDKKKRKEPHKKNRCEFFAVSAIGRYQDPDSKKWCKALDKPNQENPQPWQGTNPYEGYDPDFPAQPKDTGSNSSGSFGGFGLENNTQNNSKPQRSEITIKQGVECQPINLIEPIEWLIKGILSLSYQPSLPNPK